MMRSLPPHAPARRTARRPGAAVPTRLAAVLAVVVALVASLLLSTGGSAQAAPVPSTASVVVPAAKAPRPSQDYPRIPRSCATPQEKIPSKPVICTLNRFDKARPTILLWGDSHSWMFIPALKAAITGRDVNLVAVMMGSCPPMDNQAKVDDAVPACFRSNALAIYATRQLEATGQPYRVLLSGSWQRYVHANRVGDRATYVGQMAAAMRQGTPRLARTLRSIGAEVDVIGQVATVPEVHRRCAKGNEPFACQLPRKKSLPEAAITRDYVTGALKPVLGSRRLIDVNAYFCTAKVCKGKIGSIRTWFDDLHLSATMSARLAPYFAATVDAVAPRPASSTPVVEESASTCTLPIFC